MMKKRRGTIAARLLTALLAFSLLGQNVVTVYAETPQGEEVVIDSEEKDEETPKAEGEDEETPVPEEESTEPEEEEETESEEDEENSESEEEEEETPESEEEEEETPESEEEESTDPADEEDTEVDPEQTVELSAAVKAFLAAVDAIVIPEGDLTYETATILNEQVGAAYEAYDALSEEEMALDDVVAAAAKAEKAAALLNTAVALVPEEETPVAKVGDNNYTSLQDAIDAATDGDTITLLADVQANIVIKQSLTLDLNGHTLDGNKAGAVITVQGNSSEVTITSGTSQGTIKNGTGKGNNGGGIYAYGIKKLALTNIYITDCEAPYDGGGLYVQGKSKTARTEVSIQNSAISNNQTTNNKFGYGGAAYLQYANVTVENTSILNNSSGRRGGGIWLQYTNTTLDKVKINGNTAGEQGGAIQSEKNHLTIRDSEIINNRAQSTAGAIYYTDGTDDYYTFTLTNTKITGNRAGTDGGAIYFSGGHRPASDGTSQYPTLTINAGTVLSGNYAKKGGAIFMSGNGSALNMVAGEISNNGTDPDSASTRTSAGGGIYVSGAYKIEISGGQITGNQANEGGAIYVNAMSNDSYVAISGGKITGNSASVGGGIKLEKSSMGKGLVMTGGILCNNTASSNGDDINIAANKALELIPAGNMSQTLTTDGEIITGWYVDSSKQRWKNRNYNEYTNLSATTSDVLSLKAAHGQTYTVTYDANGGTGTVTDSSKYAEGKDVTVLDGTSLSLADNYFIGWNTKADGSGTSYKAGATFKMPGENITLYAQWLPWKTSSNLPGDMYVDASDSTKVATRQQGTTVDVTGQIEVTSIQTQLNTIATALGADSDGKLHGFDIPVSISEFQFTATMILPNGLTLPENLSEASVQSSIGDFTVTEVSTNGQTATVTFGANTDNIKTFAALKTLVKSAADKSWISITVPGVKIADNATVDTDTTGHTIKGTVTGSFKATAGVQGVNAKAFEFTWTAQQDSNKQDAFAPSSKDIQATVKVTAATPVTVKNDPPVSKTVTGNPSTAAIFEFTLTPDKDSYPLPQKNGQDSTKVTITGSGSAEFGDITFTQPGTYQYQVKETDGKVENYTYDTKVYTVVYTVTNSNGQLECVRTINGSKDTQTCSFTNSYSAPETPSTPSDDGGNGGGDNGGGSSTPSTTPAPNSVVQRITEFGNQIADAAEDIVEYITEFGSEGNESGQMTEEGHVSATGDDSLMMVYAAVAGASAVVAVLWFALRKRTHI